MAFSAKTSQFPPLPINHNHSNQNSCQLKSHNPSKSLTSPFRPKSSNLCSITRSPSESPNTPTLPPPGGRPTNSQLLKLCLRGDLKVVLKHLKLMQELGAEVEEDSFVVVIRLCEHKKGRSEGAHVWRIMLELGVGVSSVRVGKALLSMFVRFGDVGHAWDVFERMSVRDLFCWNVLVGGYAKAGHFDEALCLYHRMLWIGVRPDVYTFPSVLRSCGGARDWVRGREVHCHVLRFGLELDVDVVNALITMYVKCGDVASASLVFDQMPARDNISWNAMISGYIGNGECFEGLNLFLKMRELSVDPNMMTLTSVISGCEILADERLGREIHGIVVKTGHFRVVSVCNSLIQLYLSSGKWEEGERVFSRMPSRDVITWTTMISGYEDNMLPKKALETYKAMEMEGVPPDEITIGSLLSSCGCLGELDMGMKLHELANKTGLISKNIVGDALIDMYSKCKCIDKAMEVFHSIRDRTVISWTSIIVGLRINNRSIEALDFFRQMKLNPEPNTVTLVAALSACGRIGALMCGKEIHAHALRTGLADEGFLPNAILDAYVRCGRMPLAENQFNSQEKDVVTWNTFLTGYAQRSQGARAIGLFKRMIKSKVRPDNITFISLLCACSRSGMVSAGLEYFNTMQQNFGIVPNLKHYACVVDLLGRAGLLDDAHDFIQKMPVKPDAAVWGALLNACRLHQQVELGEIAAEQIFKEERVSVRYHVLFCNLYEASGKWDEVAKVRNKMREEGLISDPGCSWVEVKGKVHAFLSDDRFHPEINDINALLCVFYEKMKAAGLNGQESCSIDKVETCKEDIFCGHSERLAVAFGLISTAPGVPIWVTKNLYMCQSCHSTIKFISKAVRREITVRDTDQFHYFKDGSCSCGDEGLLRRTNSGNLREHG